MCEYRVRVPRAQLRVPRWCQLKASYSCRPSCIKVTNKKEEKLFLSVLITWVVQIDIALTIHKKNDTILTTIWTILITLLALMNKSKTISGIDWQIPKTLLGPSDASAFKKIFFSQEWLAAISDNDKSDWSCTLYRLKVKVQIPKLNIARDGKGYPVSVFVSHVTFKSFMISFHKLSQKVQITSSSKKWCWWPCDQVCIIREEPLPRSNGMCAF